MDKDQRARQEAALKALWAKQDAETASIARARAKPGWYPHPTMAETRRYWNGEAWTDHIAPAEQIQPTTPGVPTTGPAANDYKGMIAGGVAMALLIPIVGFVIGCFLLGKRPGPGIGIMIIAVMAGLFWFDQLTADALGG